FPARAQKTGFGMPAHGKRFAAIEHPTPIHAVINFRGKILDFLIGKILPRGKNTAKENRRIDGRKFALGPAFAGFHVDEMEEESVLVVQVIGEETQRKANALDNFRRLPVAAMVTDTKTSQAKTGGGDARHGVRIIAIRSGAVFYLAGFRAGFVPEKIKTGAK